MRHTAAGVAMTAVTTRDGDMIDAVAWNHYGFHAGTVEAVLEANPRLAQMPPVLDGGLQIILPEIAAPATDTTVKLYD